MASNLIFTVFYSPNWNSKHFTTRILLTLTKRQIQDNAIFLICDGCFFLLLHEAVIYKTGKLNPFTGSVYQGCRPLCLLSLKQNLDIHLLQLHSSSSSHFASHLRSPLHCHSFLTCACASVPSFSLTLGSTSTGAFCYSVFALCFVLCLFGKPERNLLSFWCTAHVIYSVPQWSCLSG